MTTWTPHPQIPTSHCCETFAEQAGRMCETHDDPWECPDYAIAKTKDGWGIPIRDGGSSFYEIHFCPWCGAKLKQEDKSMPTLGDKIDMMQEVMAAAEAMGPMYTWDIDYWLGYFGGQIPPDSFLQTNWPMEIQHTAQETTLYEVPVEAMIQMIWHNAHLPQEDITNIEAFIAKHGKAFFKVGQRTTKDAMQMVCSSYEEWRHIVRNSERAMEEVAVANASHKATMLLSFRDAIEEDIDPTEMRVLIVNKKIVGASTGPYAKHTLKEARRLWRALHPLAVHVAEHLHVDAWADLIHTSRGNFLCDLNQVATTTWPGHFAYRDDTERIMRSHSLIWDEGADDDFTHSHVNMAPLWT